LWPDRSEAQRRAVLSAAVVGCGRLKGRLQREGIVTHIIIDKVINYTPLLRGIGDRNFRFGRGLATVPRTGAGLMSASERRTAARSGLQR
jgi:error-prone DNA polymerase